LQRAIVGVGSNPRQELPSPREDEIDPWPSGWPRTKKTCELTPATARSTTPTANQRAPGRFGMPMLAESSAGCDWTASSTTYLRHPRGAYPASPSRFSDARFGPSAASVRVFLRMIRVAVIRRSLLCSDFLSIGAARKRGMPSRL